MDSNSSNKNLTKGKDKRVCRIKVATWNVRTLLDADRSTVTERRTAVLGMEFARYDLDIVCLQECHRKGFGQLVERASGYTYFWSGSDGDDNCNGVAIAVKTKLINRGIVSQPTAISDRLMSLMYTSGKERMRIVCCYAPTMSYAEADRVAFFARL